MFVAVVDTHDKICAGLEDGDTAGPYAIDESPGIGRGQRKPKSSQAARSDSVEGEGGVGPDSDTTRQARNIRVTKGVQKRHAVGIIEIAGDTSGAGKHHLEPVPFVGRVRLAIADDILKSEAGILVHYEVIKLGIHYERPTSVAGSAEAQIGVAGAWTHPH